MQANVLTLLAIIFGAKFYSSEAAKILFLLPLSTHSHMKIFEPLIGELVSRNHEVTLLSSLHSEISRPNFRQYISVPANILFAHFRDPLEIRRSKENLRFPLAEIVDSCEQVFNSSSLTIVMNSTYDLIFVNGFLSNCLNGLLHLKSTPFIIVTTMVAPSFVSERVGSFWPPSILPLMNNGDYTDAMSFKQRLLNTGMYWVSRLVFSQIFMPAMESVYTNHLRDHVFPSLTEIENNASLVMMNSHFSMGFNRPLLPAIVEIGGIHCEDSESKLSAVSFL